VSSRSFRVELIRIGLYFLLRTAKNKHVFEHCPRLPKPLPTGNRPGEPSALKALQHSFALEFAVGTTIGL
jgi:hypothetical protein